MNGFGRKGKGYGKGIIGTMGAIGRGRTLRRQGTRQAMQFVRPATGTRFSPRLGTLTPRLAERTADQGRPTTLAFRPAGKGGGIGIGLQTTLPLLPPVQISE